MCNLCESYIFVQVVMINEAEHKMFIIKYYTTHFFINYDNLNLDSNFMIYMIGNCILITNFTGFFFNLQPLQMYSTLNMHWKVHSSFNCTYAECIIGWLCLFVLKKKPIHDCILYFVFYFNKTFRTCNKDFLLSKIQHY